MKPHSTHASQSDDLIWSMVNGVEQDVIAVADRGFAYGDGLFETIFCRHDDLPLLENHLVRLKHGCERLHIPYPFTDIQQSIQAAKIYLSKRKPDGRGTILKMIVTRGRGGRGYMPPSAKNTQPSVVIQLKRFERDLEKEQNGVCLLSSNVRLASQPLLAGIKHLNRLEYTLAAKDIVHHSGDKSVSAGTSREALLCDQRDQVIESVHHNVFLVKGKTIVTPLLDNCGVTGVFRTWLAHHLASDSEFSFVECPVNMQMLKQADEIFIGNSVRGIWPVNNVDGESYAVGACTKALQHEFNQILWHSQG